MQGALDVIVSRCKPENLTICPTDGLTRVLYFCLALAKHGGGNVFTVSVRLFTEGGRGEYLRMDCSINMHYVNRFKQPTPPN